MAIQIVRMTIGGMRCAECAAGIEKVVAHVRGVTKASVSFGAQAFDGEYDDDILSEERIAREVKSLGYEVVE